MSTDAQLSPEELGPKLVSLQERARLLGAYLNPEAVEAQIAELEQAMQAPGFWDDQKAAAKTSAAHAAATQRLADYHELTQELADAVPDAVRELLVVLAVGRRPVCSPTTSCASWSQARSSSSRSASDRIRT